jgi:predicted metal-dependent hydrolase
MLKRSSGSVLLDGEPLEYVLRRTGRRKTVAITVEPSGAVTVSAPTTASIDQVEQISYPAAQLDPPPRAAVLSLPPAPAPREWVSGETHRYLGRQYRLKVEQGAPTGFGWWAGTSTPRWRIRSTGRSVQRRMERWYLDHARVVFTRRLVELVRSLRGWRCVIPAAAGSAAPQALGELFT